jgi:hypothetical protein
MVLNKHRRFAGPGRPRAGRGAVTGLGRILEKGTKLAQKLGRLQPFTCVIAVLSQGCLANWHILGQPNTFLAACRFVPPLMHCIPGADSIGAFCGESQQSGGGGGLLNARIHTRCGVYISMSLHSCLEEESLSR